MKLVPVTTFYLQMLTPPNDRVNGLAARHDCTVIPVVKPTVAYYRWLYDAVGGPYNWISRKKLSDEALQLILNEPGNELRVLHWNGEPAGFAEWDARKPADVELVQFGLRPEFIGQGLGKMFLHWTISEVWSRGPKRFWLHTCTQDHPSALKMYTRAGFELYHQEDSLEECPE